MERELLQRVKRQRRFLIGQIGQGEPIQDCAALLFERDAGRLLPLGKRCWGAGQQGLQQVLLRAVVADPVEVGSLLQRGCRRERLFGRLRTGRRAVRR